MGGFTQKKKLEFADKAWLASRFTLFFLIVMVTYAACFFCAAIAGLTMWVLYQTEWLSALMAFCSWYSFLQGRERLLAPLPAIFFNAEERLDLKLDTKK